MGKNEKTDCKMEEEDTFVHVQLPKINFIEVKLSHVDNERTWLLSNKKNKDPYFSCCLQIFLTAMSLILTMAPGAVLCDRLISLECTTKCPELWFPLCLLPIPVALACMSSARNWKAWIITFYIIAIPSLYCFHQSLVDVTCLKEQASEDVYFKAAQGVTGVIGTVFSLTCLMAIVGTIAYLCRR